MEKKIVTVVEDAQRCVRDRQQREPSGWCLQQAARSRGADRWSVLPPTPGGFALAGSRPAGGLQPPQHLLEKQHSKL